MADTGNAPKSDLTAQETCPAKSARCAGNKFRYSRFPVKCQTASPYRSLPRSPFTISLSGFARIPSIGTKSCPESPSCIPVRHVLGTCKRSLSMIDLSQGIGDLDPGDMRSDSSSTLSRLEEIGDRAKEALPNIGKMWIDVSEGTEECRLARYSSRSASLICHLLMLNAWRRRREEIAQLRDVIDRLSQQIEHMHIQIIVLRRLLKTENDRLGKLSGEAHRAKSLLDETTKERNALKMEKEKLEEKLRKTSEISEQRLVLSENLRNDLFTAQNQLEALDSQISRDREKLLKLREDKRILLDKVSAAEALATERGGRAERAESAIEELQLRLAAQIAMVESSQEQIQRYSRELNLKEDERIKLEKRLRTSEETGRNLSLRVTSLEAQLADREAALRRVELAYNSQMTELNDLRDRLVRQSQESGWSSRMLQIAGTVVRAPRAILRTLSFLSSTGATLPA